MTRGRQVKLGFTFVLVALIVGGFWILRTGMAARNELMLGKTRAQMLASHKVSKEPARIARLIDEVNGHVQRANKLTHDPIWWMASHIPFVGRTPNAVRTSVASLSAVLDAVAQSDGDLASYRRRPGHIVDRALLKIAGGILADIKQPTLISVDQMQKLNLAGVPSVIANPVKQVRDQFITAQPYVEQGQTFIKVAPVLLGLDKPKNWLLVMNNGAEARATGGLPGGWATLSAKDGHLELTHLETNSAISAQALKNWQDYVPDDMQALYGYDLAHLPDMNLSPDYPTNARLMNALYEQHTGGRVDGVISIDEFTLAGLMAVTGPVNVGKRHLTSGSVVDYVTKGVYSDYPNPKKKDEAVMDITRRVFKHLSYASVRDVELARALIPSIYRGRLHVWAMNKEDQILIHQTVLSGAMDNAFDPTHMAVIINAAGNKIDAYVTSTVSYTQGKCLAELPYRESVLAVQLHNAAPDHGLPTYVTPRNDKGYRDDSKPGSTMSAVFMHVPLGSEFGSAVINGKPAELMNEGTDHGRDVWEFHVELPALAARTLNVTFNEPVLPQDGPPVLGVQPMAIPMQTSVAIGPHCE
jgi:hypothetical protein